MAMSLLDTVTDSLAAAGRPLVTLSRVCLVGKLSGVVPDATFKTWCETYVRSPAEVTGLLLLLDSGFLATIEGPTNDLLPLLKAMAEQLEPGGSLAAVKVVSQQEDVRSRYFPSWLSHKMSVVRSNYAELEVEGALTALLAETVIAMLKLGKALKSNSDVAVLDHWEEEKELADMPSNERVAQLLEITEIPPLEEFMRIFELPVDIVMESDRVWPPPHPQPY